MIELNHINKVLHERLEYITGRFAVKRIGIFGSYSHGSQTSASDLDVMVEFRENATTFDNYMDLKFYLEDLFGIKVDLVVAGDVRDEIRDEVMADIVYV